MVTPAWFNNLPNAVQGVLVRFQPARGPQRWVGLDVGGTSIKLVELEQGPTGVRLIRQLIQELPASPGGQVADRIGWLQSALKECGAERVHVSVSGPSVAIRRIPLPLMSRRELPEAVKWQVKEHIPFSIQEAVIDFRVIGEVWDKDIKKQDVLVAAAAQPFLREVLDMIERAGARVESLVPAPFALCRAISTLVPNVLQGSVAIVELGAFETHLTVVKDGQIRLVRTLAIGSGNVTESLMGVVASERGEVAIDFLKAETFKRRYGVLTETAQGATDEGVPLFHLASLMRPVLENLLTELSRLLAFYRSQMDEAGVSRVLLCGGGASLKSFTEFLADGLGVTVEAFNPLARITDRVQRLEAEQVAEGGPRLAVAIGLALDHGQSMNLLPPDRRRRVVFTASRQMWLPAVKGLVAAAIALFLGLQFISVVLEWTLRHDQRVWAQLEPEAAHAAALSSGQHAAEGTIAQLQQFLDQQPVWDGILKEVGAAVPAGVECDEITVAPDESDSRHLLRLHVRGRVVSGALGGDGSVSKFVEALERSVSFKDVRLMSSEIHPGEAESTKFTVAATLE